MLITGNPGTLQAGLRKNKNTNNNLNFTCLWTQIGEEASVLQNHAETV